LSVIGQSVRWGTPAVLSTLRKTFGADRELMRTVSGRGYRFTGEIRLLPIAEWFATPPPR
jgi:DNA-binding winged helix-turn-helix (wHTH) protein